MNISLKRVLTLFLAFLLAFSSVIFVFSNKDEARAFAGNTAAATGIITTSVIVIARQSVQPKVYATVQPQATQNVCAFPAQAALLQDAVSAGLFTKPASCFSINEQKAIAIAKPLAVNSQPEVLPQIIVLNYPDKIQDEFSLPVYPLKDQSGVMPIAVAIFASLVIFSGKTGFEKSKLSNKNNWDKILPLPQLEILRC